MSEGADEHVLRALRQYVSPLNARVILEQARQRVGPAGGRRALAEATSAAAGLFVSPAVCRQLLRELHSSLARAPATMPPPTNAAVPVAAAPIPLASADVSAAVRAATALTAVERRVPITAEADVSVARLAAWELCQQLGARRLAQQKVATAVSELSRNIVMYTPGGLVVLRPLAGEPPRVYVLAEDRGTGIAQLDAVLSGAYRSRTGLGRGLLGVKRLMDHFEVRSSPNGTRIEAEAVLR